MNTAKLKTTWTPEEDKVLFDLMSHSIKKGSTINAAAKIASEVLEEQGFYRKTAACSFRWHHVHKKNNQVPHESLQEEAKILTAVPMEESPEITKDTAPLEIIIDQENLIPTPIESPIELSLDYIRTYCARLQEENKALKEEVESLQEMKNKYENLKELLLQHS